MQFLVDFASWCLILAGSAFLLIGAIGVIRLPDFYTRLHAAGLADAMGAGFFLAGLLLQAGIGMTGLKLVLILLFIVLTSPVATHALINAAFTAKLDMPTTQDRTSEKNGGEQS
ncbi:MAG: sodium:proton antiporter [Alphaproteobacteria bacterium]|nr:sodium:proton antiporter [Alphaproteobacteria bacterium]